MWTYLHIEIRPELQEFPSLYLDCRSISSCSLPCGHCTAAAGCLYTWPCCTWSLCTGTPRGRGTRTSICSLFWRFPSPSNASLWEEPSFFNNRAPERSPWPRTLSASLRTAWRCSARPWLGRQLRDVTETGDVLTLLLWPVSWGECQITEHRQSAHWRGWQGVTGKKFLLGGNFRWLTFLHLPLNSCCKQK